MNLNRSESLGRQISALHDRLEKLYANLDHANRPPEDVIASVWKDLGIAAEELQVANEELSQQSDQIALMLQDASVQHHYYQNLINRIPEAYLTTTPEGKIQEANLIAAGLFNLPQTALIGKLLVTFVPPEQRMAFRTELLRLTQESRPRTWSGWFQPHNLTPIYLTVTVAAVVDNPQEPVSLHWVLREASEAWIRSSLPQQERFAEDDDRDLAVDRPILRYSKGEAIPLTPQNLWLVYDGLVKLHTLTEENEEVLLGLVGPLMPFATGASFLPVYQATAVTDVQLLQFSGAEVKTSPRLARLILPKLNDRLQQMEALLSIAGQRRVRQRLYLLLRLLKQKLGEPIADGVRLKVRLTHEEIASACCTSRVTITRLLGELQRQRRITIDSRFHIVLPSDF